MKRVAISLAKAIIYSLLLAVYFVRYCVGSSRMRLAPFSLEPNIHQCRICSIAPTKSLLFNNNIKTSLIRHWKTDGHLGIPCQKNPDKVHYQKIYNAVSHGLTSANKFSFHRGRHRVEFPRGALVSHGVYACIREDQVCAGSGSHARPAEITENVQSVQVDGVSQKNSELNRFVVVNFYHFVNIEDPEKKLAKHRSFLQGRNIHGRIYINQQGINAQYSGPSLDALAYADWVKEDSQFKDILVQISPSADHAFPRMKLRYKSSLVQVEGGVSHLPLLDPSMRAVPLTPSEWRKRLENADSSETKLDESPIGENTSLDKRRKMLLLDVRNGYEWDVGHFQEAQRPDVDCFRSTAFGLSDSKISISDPLVGVDKESTDIMMYCTGGIRCDVYSAILRQRGFQNLYTLKGGIAHYLKEEGPSKWIGNLFVFDSRLSISPSVYKPMDTTNKQVKDLSFGDKIWDKDCRAAEKRTFGRCCLCGSHLSEIRHRNCANLDCNKLILSCHACVEEFKGCCSMACTCAPRLRPILPSYERWHKYRDLVHKS